jgi:hypothetical protein
MCKSSLCILKKEVYQGAEMKEVMWLAARATTVSDWQRAMQRMNNLNEYALMYTMKVYVAKWTRSAYNTNTQCDLHVNNMCEAPTVLSQGSQAPKGSQMPSQHS